MRIMVDDGRIKELIKHIMKNNFGIYDIDEIKRAEEEILRRFNEEEVIGFIYSYISDLLKNIVGNSD